MDAGRELRDRLSEAGLVFSGTSPDKRLVEMVELANHPYFVACQFHPEFKSRPTRPHPLFAGFIAAATKAKRRRGSGQGSASLVEAAD